LGKPTASWLQKYLKVNYEEARDNQQMAGKLFGTQRQQYRIQQVGETAQKDLELHSSLYPPDETLELHLQWQAQSVLVKYLMPIPLLKT